jgi:hypothetical protein
MNITIALSINYGRKNVLPFLKSYNKYASGDLYLITDRPDQFTGFEKVKTVNIFDMAKKYKINLNLTPFNLKPILYYFFLKDFKEDCNVLLTDVDVIFQEDPFKILEKVKTDTFIICEEKKLYSECDTNTTWFNMGYSPDYDKVKDKKILNCGITIGSKESIKDYQKQVAYELQNVLARQYYFAYDQVILNVLYYVFNSIKPTILTHGNDYIVHLAHVSDNELTNDNVKNAKLYASNDEPYPIVHQFNERPVLSQMFETLYKD